MPTLAIVTHEVIGERMAGPAIRAFELARAVGPEIRSVLASPYPITRRVQGVETRTYTFGDERSMEQAVAGADAILIQGFTLFKFPALISRDIPIIVDLYCPFQFENLERRRLVEPDATNRQRGAQFDRQVLNQQLERGDFFLCANDRQRDYWLGMLTAVGRLATTIYDADPLLDSLLAIVPFGIDSEPPVVLRPVIRGVHPGVGPGDRLIIWGGSVTDWHDPITPIRAVARLASDLPNIRLAFTVGLPSPEAPPMLATERARAEARALGLLDRFVLFVDWIPWDDRGSYLTEAEIGVSAHTSTLETRYAWRVRLLDYIWASLPIVCTRGDGLAEDVEREGLGIAVDPGDDAAMAEGFRRILGDAEFAHGCRERLTRTQPRLHWRQAAAPLRRFAQAPRRAADLTGAPAEPPRSRLATLTAALRRRLGQ